jgi:group I intron endonuclease
MYYNYNHLSSINMLINKAILKVMLYSNFKLEILEYSDKDKNLEREQYYLDLIKPEYNILQTAGSMFGYKHTEDTVLKMREAKLGISRDEETKAKISASLKVLKNNEEASRIRANIGASRGTTVQVYDLDTDTTLEFTSMSKAAIELNTTHTTISTYIKNKNLFYPPCPLRGGSDGVGERT